MTRWASRTSSDFSLGPQGTNIFGERRGSDHGFTIVELLIVVVVIAILAAITIVAYNGITNRAKASAASSAAEQASKKVALYAIQNSEAFPAALSDAGVSDQNGTSYQYRTYNSGQNYCITATSNSVSYYIDNAAHGTPTAGVCAGHVAAGQTVVTNLVTNPSLEIDASGYSSSGGAIFSRSTDWSDSGLSSLKMSSPGTSNAGDVRFNVGGLTSFPLGLQPGHTYTLRARVRMPVAYTGGYNRGPGILYWYSTDGATFTENFGPKVGPAAGTYLTQYTFSIPSNATGIYLGFGAASSTANQIIYYDSIMLSEGNSTYNYADGGTTGWAWNGAPNSSTSTGPAL